MKRANERLDTAEHSTAYRVASLLQQPPSPNARDTDTHSLRSMTSQIEQFLSTAPHVPAVCMEPEWTACDSSEMNEEEEAYDALLRRSGQPVVQLNVVAGVLEESDPAGAPGHMASLNGVLLPTAGNQQELHRRKAEQAQAMLDLMSALAPSGFGNGRSSNSNVCGDAAAQPNANLSTRAVRHPSSDSDDDEVAVMDADDLNDEDTSDEEEMPAQRRRVQEMN